MTGTTPDDAPPGPDDEAAGRLAACALDLAGRFAAGATLWAVAPGREDHASHVAVEFVHPVIVGKRSLPAIAATGGDPTDRVRTGARSGDLVLLVGPGDDPVLGDIARRTPAWGLTTAWIGWGSSRPDDCGAHRLWLDGDAEEDVVRSYHLLWELVHVCLEQPDVLPGVGADPASCPVCADDLDLAEVAVPDGDRAVVRTPEGTTTVDTTLVGPIRTHDLVLVQAGVALQTVTGDAL